MFKKLHVKIAGFVAILLILTVIVLQFSTTHLLKSMLEDQAKESTSSLLNSIKGNIELQLENYEIALNRMSDSRMAQSFLEDDQNKLLGRLINDELKQIKDKNEFVTNAYIATSKKIYGYTRKPNLIKILTRRPGPGTHRLPKRLIK